MRDMEDESIVLPGERIGDSEEFMMGHGTYLSEGHIYAALVGQVQKTSKLISVLPIKHKYLPEVGDVIVGRITQVESREWRVEMNSVHEGRMLLTAINLPGGEQRRRSEEDKLHMHLFFGKNDIFSGEIQSLNPGTGIPNIHTRNLKYGKLHNGFLVKVHPHLIRRMKHHFVDIEGNIRLIIGLNGYIWIYYDKTPHAHQALLSGMIDTEQNINIGEDPTEHIIARKEMEIMARVGNCIRILDMQNIWIYLSTIREIYDNSNLLNISISEMVSEENIEKLGDIANELVIKESEECERRINVMDMI